MPRRVLALAAAWLLAGLCASTPAQARDLPIKATDPQRTVLLVQVENEFLVSGFHLLIDFRPMRLELQRQFLRVMNGNQIRWYCACRSQAIEPPGTLA